jgi:hypothetical protein
MAHFAEIRSDNNIVLRVIIANNEDIKNNGGEYSAQSEQWAKNNYPNDPLILEELSGIYPQTYWKQTSYNTRAGVHQLGGTPKRKNYAGEGMFYDSQKDAFYWPKTTASWIYNDQKGAFEPPVAKPNIYQINNKPILPEWDEENLRWIGITLNLVNGQDNAAPYNSYYWNPNSSSWIQI